MPKLIEKRNIKDTGLKKTKEDIAGPGHKPTIPQPMPNNEEPMIKFLSKSFLEGICNS